MSPSRPAVKPQTAWVCVCRDSGYIEEFTARQTRRAAKRDWMGMWTAIPEHKRASHYRKHYRCIKIRLEPVDE